MFSRSQDRSQESERDPSPVAASSSAQESLSIEETNKLRAKLGLKPLQVAEKPAGMEIHLCNQVYKQKAVSKH